MSCDSRNETKIPFNFFFLLSVSIISDQAISTSYNTCRNEILEIVDINVTMKENNTRIFALILHRKLEALFVLWLSSHYSQYSNFKEFY